MKTPWHLWVVVAFGVLWNGYGAYDYVMSLVRGGEYMRDMGMTEPQIAHFEAMPSWMYVVWTVGVWGSVLGTILLALRSRWATLAFEASMVGVVLMLIYNYALSDGAEVMGEMAFMSWVIAALAALFLAYALWMTRRGVLR